MTVTRRDMISGGFALSGLHLRAQAATQAIGGPAFGSTWRMVLPADVDAARARQAVAQIIAQVDAAMSPWRPDSEVALFDASTSTDWQGLSATTLAVIGEAQAPSPMYLCWSKPGDGPVRWRPP